MMTPTEIKANKLWSDVMKGHPKTFESTEETRTICRHSAYMEIIESHAEEIIALTIAGKGCDMYIKFEAMKLVKQQLIEAIEDFEA